MTRLWLARHGQTDWNLEGRYHGQADPPLNANGVAQAECLATQISGAALTAIYSSDLQRAQVTAEIVARPLRLAVQIDRRWRDINLGEWDGMLETEVRLCYPQVWNERKHNPLHVRTPGGESLTEVAARVWGAADEVAQTHPTGPVLIVSHGLALAALLCRAQALPLEQAYALIPENAQLVVVDWES